MPVSYTHLAEIYRLGRSEGEIGVNNLTWETVTKMNAGIDLGLWNGSVNLVDVYKRQAEGWYAVTAFCIQQ